MVQSGLSTEVLLALLDAPEDGVPGVELQTALARHGRSVRADQLLVALLGLEGTDHVAIDRAGPMRFGLTGEGRERAVEVGGGRPVHVRLLMVDLVGFVAFTVVHGDEAAHSAARSLAVAARAALRSVGGEVVKELGDGVLAWLPPAADPSPVVRQIAEQCHHPDGGRWPLRAASHVGNPIRCAGDLFGADVNLVARLCDLAEPDQLMDTVANPIDDGGGSGELIEVRGVTCPVTVTRSALT